MKYTETEFYRRLHIVFPGFIKRVENELEVGTPDTYFATPYAVGWMELKCYKGDRARGNATIPFRPGQFPWLKDNWQYGGLSIVAVWGADGYYFFVNHHIQTVYETKKSFIEHAMLVEEMNRESIIDMLKKAKRVH